VGDARLSDGFVSAAAFAAIARDVPAFGGRGVFDLRRLGLLYTIVVAAVLAGGLLAGADTALCFVLAWVFADPNYLGIANSLYSEPPALVATLGLTLWFSIESTTVSQARRARAVGCLVALFALLAVGSFSRAPMAVLPCLVAVLVWERWLQGGAPRLSRSGAIVCGALALFATFPAAHFTLGDGPRFATGNAFNSVFMGPLLDSPHPETTLAHLGLPPRFARYAGKSYYDVGVPRGLQKRLANVSYSRRVFTYLVEPDSLRRVGSHVAGIFAVGVRALSAETETVPARADPWWRFGRLRSALLASHPSAVWVLWLGLSAFVAAALARRVSLRAPYALAFLCALGITQTVIAVLGDGTYGLARHLLVARFSFDCALALSVGELARIGAARFGRRTA
jgi:hypothetical protein